MKRLIPLLLIISLLLTACESSFNQKIAPAKAQFKSKADEVQADINALANNGTDGSNEDADSMIGDIGDSITESAELITDIGALQEEMFGNPNFLALTTTLSLTMSETVPISYYANAPQPIRQTAYSMDQIEPGDETTMSALDMVTWLAMAVALPFTLVRSLTATTAFIGPLGLLLSWVTIAGIWFMSVNALEFIISLIRNGGGILKIFTSIVRIFK